MDQAGRDCRLSTKGSSQAIASVYQHFQTILQTKKFSSLKNSKLRVLKAEGKLESQQAAKE